MPIKIYQSQVNPQVKLQSPGAAVQQASVDLTASQGVRIVQSLGDKLQAMSNAGMKYEKDKMEAQIAADILDESTKLSDSAREFESDYMKTMKGVDARDAVSQWDQYLGSAINKRSRRFDGADPQVKLLWEREAARIRQSSLNRAVGYADQQDTIYREDTTKARTANYMQRVVEAADDRQVANMTRMYKAEVLALNPGRDMTAEFAKTDLDVAVTRINTALATGTKEGVTEAERLKAVYKGVLGASYDDMAKRVTDARTEVDALNMADSIRTRMPEATLTEMYDEVDKLSGDRTDLNRMARYHVRGYYSSEKLQEKEQHDATVLAERSRIADAKTPQARHVLITEYNARPDLPEKTRQQLVGEAMRGLSAPLQSDEKKLAEVRGKVADEQITATDLERDYKYFLSDTDYKEQMNRVKTLGGARVTKYENDMEARLGRAFAEVPKSQRTAAVTRTKKFMKQFVEEYQSANGKMPSDKELRDHETWLLQDTVFNENWYGDSTTQRVRVGLLPDSSFDVPDDFKAKYGDDDRTVSRYRKFVLMEEAADIKDVPGDFKRDARKQLTAAGKDASDAAIIRIYNLYRMDTE